jgi:hypothetical protein
VSLEPERGLSWQFRQWKKGEWGVVRERMLIKMSTPQACIDARCLDVGSFCSYVQKSIDDCINL